MSPAEIGTPGSAGKLATAKTPSTAGKPVTTGTPATACSKGTAETSKTAGMKAIAGPTQYGRYQSRDLCKNSEAGNSMEGGHSS